MIKGIFACDLEGGMGKDGTLPWPKNSEDLKHFSKMTTGCTVIMGSKTWEDPCFPAPLKYRDNLVISNRNFREFKDATVIGCDKEFIKYLETKSSNDIWVIGGASVFEQLHDIIDEYHVTVINGNYNCDVFFPFDLEDFEEVSLDSSKETGNKYMVFKKAENT